uniref:Biliverdin reductase A n=1 Tax=Callithrix jacchus TaxID=9483 RepID=A0A8I3W6T3_CALJA
PTSLPSFSPSPARLEAPWLLPRRDPQQAHSQVGKSPGSSLGHRSLPSYPRAGHRPPGYSLRSQNYTKNSRKPRRRFSRAGATNTKGTQWVLRGEWGPGKRDATPPRWGQAHREGLGHFLRPPIGEHLPPTLATKLGAENRAGARAVLTAPGARPRAQRPASHARPREAGPLPPLPVLSLPLHLPSPPGPRHPAGQPIGAGIPPRSAKPAAPEGCTESGTRVRRELGSIDGVQQISLEDALSSQEVEVAYICSESSSHEDYIRQFLNAGKHVLVEYPMTLSLVAAQALWELAAQKGKVLHEEHVELLMEEFAFLKKEVVGKDLLKGSLLFTAGPLEEERFGFPAFSGISRLTWLVSLFGELSLVSATLEERKEDQYMKMTVCLETEKKSPLTWIEEKGPGLKRNRYLSFHFKSGSLENVPNVGINKNIFLKDQNIFVQKLLGQFSEKELAAEKKRILHCLGLAEEIQKYCCSGK